MTYLPRFLFLLLVAAQAAAPLVVTSDPSGAAVYLDERLVGTTPLSLADVGGGSYRVRLTKAGYLENQRVIAVSAGKPVVHHVALTRAPQPDGAGASEGNWFSRRKWLWIGAAAAGGTAAALSLRPTEPVIPGTIVVSPPIGLQAATPVAFASQGAGGGSTGTLTYAWNFGDGATGSGALVTHVYNNAGTFTVTVDVSDGKKSATANGSVQIKSLTGNWRGTLGGVFDVLLTLVQNGAAVSGTYRHQAVTATVTGTVKSTSRHVTLTISAPGYAEATFTADPDQNADSLTGTFRQDGLTLDLRVVRE